MSRFASIWVLVLALASCDAPAPSNSGGGEEADPLDNAETRWDRWRFHIEEDAVDQLVVQLTETSRPETIAFVGVTVVDPLAGTLAPGSTVVVSDGRIQKVGSVTDVDIPDDARRVDGTGRFLMPGLVDMHVHSLVSSGQKILNLANGVTSVRDLDGFPWLLRERDAIRTNRLLAPNLYVSGHILNSFPMEFYFTVVRTPEEAREAVREQQRLGYDFIKIHNRMRLEVYRAVIEEARAVGLDVVGHVPQELTLREAIDLGQRTFEHFKGFYLDRTLELSSEDRAALVRGRDIWICPTLGTVRMGLRGQEAVDFVDRNPAARFVSVFDRRRWRETYVNATDDVAQRVYAMSQQIMRELVPIDAKFLAGTDSGGGYDFMVPGFSLHEELRLLAENGLPWVDVLRAATSNAAAAIRREAEFGAVAAGQRADLLLLEADPLSGRESLQRLAGVAVRGIWLPKSRLDEMLDGLREIYDHAGENLTLQEPSRVQIDSLVQSRLDLAARGFIHRDHQLEELTTLLERAGRQDVAKQIVGLRMTPVGTKIY